MLEKYCDDRWGFLRLAITDRLITGRYFTVPRPNEPFSKTNQLLDYFEYGWKRKVYIGLLTPCSKVSLAAPNYARRMAATGR